eukprot:SM000120S25717  [mRNA]  locus=s120:429327:430865:+ [translate_table: standard]
MYKRPQSPVSPTPLADEPPPIRCGPRRQHLSRRTLCTTRFGKHRDLFELPPSLGSGQCRLFPCSKRVAVRRADKAFLLVRPVLKTLLLHVYEDIELLVAQVGVL